MKNTGLNIELEKQHQSETDYTLGAVSEACIGLIPEMKREFYLPSGRVQRGREDFQSCASIGPVNLLETKFNFILENVFISEENRAWLHDNGYITEQGVQFSDRWIAINSNTTRQGNSMIAPLQAIHSKGLIPEKMLPTRQDMTWDEYHNKEDLTSEMETLGKEFLKRFPIFYERVNQSDFKRVQEKDLLDLAGFAWVFPDEDGIYQKRDGAIPNHVFLGVRPDIFIYDSYVDTHDGDFIKHLATDYGLLPYAYRLIINENKKQIGEPVITGKGWLVDLITNFYKFLIDSIIKLVK